MRHLQGFVPNFAKILSSFNQNMKGDQAVHFVKLKCKKRCIVPIEVIGEMCIALIVTLGQGWLNMDTESKSNQQEHVHMHNKSHTTKLLLI